MLWREGGITEGCPCVGEKVGSEVDTGTGLTLWELNFIPEGGKAKITSRDAGRSDMLVWSGSSFSFCVHSELGDEAEV